MLIEWAPAMNNTTFYKILMMKRIGNHVWLKASVIFSKSVQLNKSDKVLKVGCGAEWESKHLVEPKWVLKQCL